MCGMEPAQGKVTHHIPQSLHTDISPDTVQLTLFIQTPDWSTSTRDFFSADALDVFTSIAKTSEKISEAHWAR